MPKKKEVTESIDSREASFNSLKTKYPDILEPPSVQKVSSDDILQTPSVSVNLLCGVDRGIRKGSIVHCYGPKHSLKTWIALEMCREAQKKWPDKTVAYIDTEYRVDLYQASRLIGLKTEPDSDGIPSLIYRRPETAEEVWEEIAALASTGHVSLIVLDSATAMRARSIVESADFSLGQIGNSARINSSALNKYAPLFPQTGTILWAVNQMRITNVQPVVTKGPTGGAAWGFFATHEFKIERVTREREETLQTLHIFTDKMKWAQSLRSVEVPIILGHGIDQEADIVTCAISAGLIEKSGSWIQIGKEKVQGLEKAKAFLQSNPEVKAELLSTLNELGDK